VRTNSHPPGNVSKLALAFLGRVDSFPWLAQGVIEHNESPWVEPGFPLEQAGHFFIGHDCAERAPQVTRTCGKASRIMGRHVSASVSTEANGSPVPS